MKAIMYHYIRDDSKELPFFRHLHIDDFKKQLNYFEKEFGFVDKQDFLDLLSKKDKGNIPKGVILTFDDGFIDHYTYVLPELIKRKLWGIFYIPYNASKRKNLLGPHSIHLLLGKFGGLIVLEELTKIITKEILSHEHVKEFQIQTYKNLSDDASATQVKRILNYYIDEKYREKILSKLMEIFFDSEKSVSKDFYMNDIQIKEMYDAGMIIGAHTVNHPVMSKLHKSEQEKEILPCFEYIEGITKNPSLRTYCHPYGGFYSFNSDTISILNKLKCLFSFNVESRDITSKDILENRQYLPRYDCNQFPFGKVRTI